MKLHPKTDFTTETQRAQRRVLSFSIAGERPAMEKQLASGGRPSSQP
jgi:hypothetical protein